jgi:hypothetical protein
MTSFQNPNIMNMTESKKIFPNYKTEPVHQTNGAYNIGPIKLKQDGGLSTIAGYSPFILRPHNNVQVPREIKRDDGTYTSCNWPSFAGSKYQEWCDPDIATKYFMFRPNMAPRYYDQIVQKMFNKVVKDSTGLSNTRDITYNDNQWAAVDCGSGTTAQAIMRTLMIKIATAVSQMPEMQRNGTYGSEQFHFTDESMYKVYSGPADAMFYHVMFNLYNPLRNVSSRVYATLQVKDSAPGTPDDISVYRLAYVNDKLWTATDDAPGTGIENYNISQSSITLPHSYLTDPTEVKWIYGNTLLDQEFNEHGFYNKESNIKLKNIGIPDSLKGRIAYNEKYNTETLFEPGKVGYTGITPNASKGPLQYTAVINDGKPHTVTSYPDLIYGPQLILDKNSMAVPQGRQDNIPIVGFINS